MNICRSCGGQFPNWIKIDGKNRNISNRKYCLQCRPFGIRTTNIIEKNHKHVNRISKRQTFTCLNCGKIIIDRRTRKYCNNKCQAELSIKQTNDKILKDGEIKGEEYVIRGKTRLYLLRMRPYQCEICKITEWQGKPVPLVVDHIDGNAENNKLENLRLICRNCDGLLPTYAARNKGNGRAWRRQRYAEGKNI